MKADVGPICLSYKQVLPLIKPNLYEAINYLDIFNVLKKLVELSVHK